MEAKFKAAIEAIELCIEDLYDQAHATCDGYINFVDAVESKSAGWKSRSNLQLSCTKKGNTWTSDGWASSGTAKKTNALPFALR